MTTAVSDPTPIEIHADSEAVAHRAATVMAAHAHAAIAARGSFSLAVSGGRTPWAMFSELGGRDIEWGSVTIHQVDERVARADDDARNLKHLLACLPSEAVEHVQPMPVEDADLEAAAGRYATRLPDRFDLIHLGLGPDGHTASLVPGDPVLDVSDRDVALSGPYEDHLRMTLTYPVLDRARTVLWVITGADKLDALKRLRARDASIPAGRVSAESSLILADEAAAGI